MDEKERYSGVTPFQTIYDSFLSLITDDMYMEWGEEETYADVKNIFLSALTSFQFPRFKPYDYEKILINVDTGDVIDTSLDTFSIEDDGFPVDPDFSYDPIDPDFTLDPEEEEEQEEEIRTMVRIGDMFNFILTQEEINIFSRLMMVEWMNRQLASVDVTRQAYSSRDFEFTSQANHLDKLIKLKESFSKEATKLQRMYTRRKMTSDGRYVPNYAGFGGKKNAN